jgi:hypothetical protein
MAACKRYVSLLRSCYSTTARFFRDDLTAETPITWYFTDPAAKWVGFPNIFNARTWYGGVSPWPDLGEIEDADRAYELGDANPGRRGGPFGTAEQWDNGAIIEEALDISPCSSPVCFPFPDFGGTTQALPNPPLPLLPFSADRYYWPNDTYRPGTFWVVEAGTGGPCCYLPRNAGYRLTDGPPAFNDVPLGPGQLIEAFEDVDCGFTLVGILDPFTGFGDAWSVVPNMPPP